MANNGSPRFSLTLQVLLIVYGLSTVFALGFSAASENRGWLDTLLIIFAAPLFAVVFFWFCFFGWWQLLKRLGFDRLLK